MLKERKPAARSRKAAHCTCGDEAQGAVRSRLRKENLTLEDRMDIAVAEHRLATAKPSEYRTLEELRKSLGR